MMNQPLHEQTPESYANIVAEATLLPSHPDHALQHLCKLSQNLLDLAERESQALIQKDVLAFAILQDEKEKMSQNYLGASSEFRARLNEFRSAPKQALQRLEDLQTELGERTSDNNALIDQMKQKAERKTQSSLLLAQEYGVSERAAFPVNTDDNGGTQS